MKSASGGLAFLERWSVFILGGLIEISADEYRHCERKRHSGRDDSAKMLGSKQPPTVNKLSLQGNSAGDVLLCLSTRVVANGIVGKTPAAVLRWTTVGKTLDVDFRNSRDTDGLP